ncbi:MAG: hypothetical protein RLZZ238_483 [Planctomycetota bacterium]
MRGDARGAPRWFDPVMRYLGGVIRSRRTGPDAGPFARRACAAAAALLLAACTGGPESVRDPAEVLARPGQSREHYFDAIEAARMRGVDDSTKSALRRMVAAEGYAIDARERAFALLDETDRAALVAALENSLPRMADIAWRERVCTLIGDRRIEALVPTLVRAWANPATGFTTAERPERIALGRVVGEERVSATLLALMREANPVTQANLRARCWELLMKSGDEPRLRALLADPESWRGDAMLTDLASVANELGVLPTTREEILWARKLREPDRAAFFARAVEALAAMPAARREGLEIRAVPVAVAALARRPALLSAADAELYDEIARRIEPRVKRSPDFTGFGSDFTEILYQQRDQAGWSDLAAMVLALDILDDPAVLRHLFEQSDRDREDVTTEFGGVIALDAEGRGELLEFPPRAKNGDLRYESPQVLFDALYTGLFHYHNHSQQYENSRYAGPHMGDFAFADSTRCNGLVFTSLSTDMIGVDFYRHGRFVVDLGAVVRPEG